MYHVIAREGKRYKQLTTNPIGIEEARTLKRSRHGDDPKIVPAHAVDEAIEKNNDWEKALEKGQK